MKRKTKVGKTKTHSQLKKELDAIISKYVRISRSDKNGIGECFTCGKRAHWKKMHCGHFISRNYLATRFDENNLRIQCPGCNLFGGGRPLDFEENLVEELGKGVVEALKKKRHEIWKLSTTWFEEVIYHYKSLLR